MRNCHTYSIVARDRSTGQLGVAVQSHWFSVGSTVPWSESGVGAVATQSFVEPAYGPSGLQLMRAGQSAPEALAKLLAEDKLSERRQVAMIDTQGRVAAHTGKLCVAEAGHHLGAGYSTQANMMLKDTVWDAMAQAYETSEGDLADRILAALEAAEAEGGDMRGRQSAAILIVRPISTDRVWQDRIFDLRVEDHQAPVEELKRLVRLNRAYDHMNLADDHLSRGDADSAWREYATAQSLAPENMEMAFWHALALANSDRVAEALPLFRKVFKADRNWASLLQRLPRVKLLRDEPTLIEEILSTTS